jgi:hypothetical protein
MSFSDSLKPPGKRHCWQTRLRLIQVTAIGLTRSVEHRKCYASVERLCFSDQAGAERFRLASMLHFEFCSVSRYENVRRVIEILRRH